MSTSRHIEKVCAFAAAAALLICILFMNGEALGIQSQSKALGYEQRLFDTSKVQTIDIVIDDWDAFLTTAQSEEYTICDVVIDGEHFSSVGIRGKGNTSLSTVSSMDSDRYSFKIEFDQYDSSKSYYGLDKLSLNNLIQDNTMMKDYLTYQMMNEFGVAAPLCSYVYITVNGEDWGLYLAVEAVEESFLQRNYGNSYGELYKPDNLSMGGGRGNGKEFDFSEFMDSAEEGGFTDTTVPEGFDPAQTGGMMPGMGSNSGEIPTMPEDFDPSQMEGVMPGGNMGSMDIGMGSSDTRLQYIDDVASSYSSIFDNAKTDVTSVDQQRLIASLKSLSQGGDISKAVDVDAVLRYFVVHNFVVNGDSYTGSMVHNYYLYEENGQLSMIPWDYNLSFGTFQSNSASDAVNDDIDAPLSVTGSDRPMIDWIFSSEEYTQMYHAYFQEFLDTVDAASIIAQAKELIAPYVEKDPTKFCTYEEFETGVQTLTAFCMLRSQSVAQQLAGQDGTVDASSIELSDMGTMGSGMGGGIQIPSGEIQMPTMPDGSTQVPGGEIQMPTMPDGSAQTPGGEMQMPTIPGGDTGGTDSQMPQIPGGQGNMQRPGMDGQNDMGTMLPGQSSDVQGGFPDMGQAGSANTAYSGQWLLWAVSALVLAAGLIVAFKFKR